MIPKIRKFQMNRKSRKFQMNPKNPKFPSYLLDRSAQSDRRSCGCENMY
jgi:hypothetical protein